MIYMKKAVICLWYMIGLTFWVVQPNHSQEIRNSEREFFLNVVLPNADTVQVSGVRYRIAASTLPDAQAFINGTSAKVYPTGAFVGLLDIAVGENPVRLTAVSATGDSLSRDFLLVRPEPLATSPEDPLVIEDVMMEPSSGLWLNHGDVLEVRFKGSPGYEATFSIPGVKSGIPMQELPPREARGLRGVYIGRYIVQERDETRNVMIEFRLKKSFWSSTYAHSRGAVSITPGDFPTVGEVTGERPFLNVGLGGDRLGGAKLQYIDSGIRIIITGRQEGQYRVQLSERMTAWIPVQFVNLLPEQTPLPKSTTGSILVTGTRTTDHITLALDQKLPYVSRQLIEPARIEIDIFGGTSNTNWITHHLAAKGIEAVTWQQFAEDQFRLTILLKDSRHWGYRVGYGGGNSLRIQVKRPPTIDDPENPLRGMTFVVDAGHGGSNNGAVGSTGAKEKDINIYTALLVRDLLVARGARVVMTREEDIDVSMAERAVLALQTNPDMLISLHANSIGFGSDPLQTYGTSTYYRHIGYAELANVLYGKMLELELNEFGVVGSFNFTLNGFNEFPNVLVEMAFISHPEDEMLLLDSGFQERMTEKIVEGIEEYLLKNVSYDIWLDAPDQ
jgi:N-acetylmuramoyl-L-alanine amidase